MVYSQQQQKKEKKTEQDRHVHPITGVFRMGGKHIYVQSEMFGKGEKKNEHEDPLGQEQVELALKKTRRRPTKRIASFQQDYSEP
jgi:hypothetical protein